MTVSTFPVDEVFTVYPGSTVKMNQRIQQLVAFVLAEAGIIPSAVIVEAICHGQHRPAVEIVI